ncbi:MAG TPA: hypothetical protein VLA19_04115 [Herpetosiphonaceae bacterium]|nr:hypothetical protein [Herpetosiphonaceae bacterium]
MNASSRVRSVAVVLFALVALAALSPSAHATHSWNNYHWARTSNPFTITVIDSMTSDWDDNLNAANSDWDASSVLNVAYEAGDESTRTRKRCPAVSGKVRSCNALYGYNGWLGLAQIWLSGGHIVQGTAKMNDSYLASSSYDETNRQHVICQEIGHDWGLGHQDESGADLNTCMDYANAFDNPDPNAHDYEQLEIIYNDHLDGNNTAAALPADVANAVLDTPAQWGREVHAAGRTSIFEREFPGGHKIITHVFWAEERGHAHDH